MMLGGRWASIRRRSLVSLRRRVVSCRCSECLQSCWISFPGVSLAGPWGAERDTSLVINALIMAVWRCGKADTLLHHSNSHNAQSSSFNSFLLTTASLFR